jgi:hypothetical protein
LRADRDADDRYDGENRDRIDNADTPDQAPLAPIAAIPRPVSRQGNPFLPAMPRLATDADSMQYRPAGCGPAR